MLQPSFGETCELLGCYYPGRQRLINLPPARDEHHLNKQTPITTIPYPNGARKSVTVADINSILDENSKDYESLLKAEHFLNYELREWKRLARIVDRLFFWMTLLALISVSAGMIALLWAHESWNRIAIRMLFFFFILRFGFHCG
jgi:hypothetical protein